MRRGSKFDSVCYLMPARGFRSCTLFYGNGHCLPEWHFNDSCGLVPFGFVLQRNGLYSLNIRKKNQAETKEGWVLSRYFGLLGDKGNKYLITLYLCKINTTKMDTLLGINSPKVSDIMRSVEAKAMSRSKHPERKLTKTEAPKPCCPHSNIKGEVS